MKRLKAKLDATSGQLPDDAIAPLEDRWFELSMLVRPGLSSAAYDGLEADIDALADSLSAARRATPEPTAPEPAEDVELEWD